MSSRSDEDKPETETLPPEAEAFERPTAVGRGVLDVTQVAAIDPPSSGRRAVGLTWADVLAMRPSLGVKLRALVETLEALAAIHTNLVRPPQERCHGALNPHLLLLSADGRVSVFWQSLDRIDPVRLLPYLAPEVQAGAEPDQQADLYAVGVMLFESLTDRLPESSEFLPFTQRDLHDREAANGAAALLKVALRALPANPRRRWPSALSFAEALTTSAGPLLSSRAELGQLVARAASQKERLLRETVRKQHALLPPPGSEPAGTPSDPGLSSLAAIAISHPAPRLYEPSTRLSPSRSRRKFRYPLYAVAVALTLTLGLWLVSRSTGETAHAPGEASEANTQSLGAPAPGNLKATESQSNLDSAAPPERHEVESESSRIMDLDEPATEETALETQNGAKAETRAIKPARAEEPGPAGATTSSEQRGTPRPKVKRKTYEPEGI